MSLPRYEQYKDSGVEWIGEIPEGWESLMIKRLSPVKRGASPRPIDDPKYFDNDGEFAWVRIADVSASERYLKITTQTLSELGSSLSVKQYPGDIFLSIAGTVGKPVITKIKCCIHDGFVYFPKLQINPEYLYYLFSTGLPYQGLGKLGTQLNLNTDTVGEIVIPIPSESEMSGVVTYLDRKTAEIDQLIANKEKLIALYEEEKTAIINRAVTRGLDPEVKTRPSGVDWLGDIPEHWEVKRLKYVAAIKYGLGQPPKEKGDGLPIIRATNVFRGKIDTNNLVLVDPEDVPYERDPILRENDIIVVRSGAYTADSAIIPKEFDGAVAGYDMVIRSYMDNPKFLSYCLLSNYVQNKQLLLHAIRAAQPHLNREELGETIILLPPIPEQTAIVTHIETECTRLDAIIDKFKKQIELFKEYRTTLISEVVTGKIDVRDEVAA